MDSQYTRRNPFIVAALAAVVIFGLGGLTPETGDDAALPKGVIEIGELEAVMVGDLNVAVLPAVEVLGSRTVQLADIEPAHDGAQG